MYTKFAGQAKGDKVADDKQTMIQPTSAPISPIGLGGVSVLPRGPANCAALQQRLAQLEHARDSLASQPALYDNNGNDYYLMLQLVDRNRPMVFRYVQNTDLGVTCAKWSQMNDPQRRDHLTQFLNAQQFTNFDLATPQSKARFLQAESAAVDALCARRLATAQAFVDQAHAALSACMAGSYAQPAGAAFSSQTSSMLVLGVELIVATTIGNLLAHWIRGKMSPRRR